MNTPSNVPRSLLTLFVAAAAATSAVAQDQGCNVTALPGVGGKNVQAWKLEDGSIAAYSRMNINIDGYGRAYHPLNRAAGAVLHLCVGGRVWLPDGTSYEGSESDATCTGKFMADMKRIAAAGWADPDVGVVQWYGIAAKGSANVAGRTVAGIKPMLQLDGSGFYVSPTALFDRRVADIAVQRRYVNPLRVASAVVPASVARAGVELGSFGVAINTKTRVAVPFIVGDRGPRVGEGSPALARQVAGLNVSDKINIENRYDGQNRHSDILWVFFGGPAPPFDHEKESEVASNAKTAFDRWGGDLRLALCVSGLPKP